jgi:hypothetical protein
MKSVHPAEVGTCLGEKVPVASRSVPVLSYRVTSTGAVGLPTWRMHNAISILDCPAGMEKFIAIEPVV